MFQVTCLLTELLTKIIDELTDDTQCLSHRKLFLQNSQLFALFLNKIYKLWQFKLKYITRLWLNCLYTIPYHNLLYHLKHYFTIDFSKQFICQGSGVQGLK